MLAEARNALGGNVILLDHQVIKHMVDLDAIHTFEGTETIQALIVGRDITGISASPNGSDRALTQRPRQSAGCRRYGLAGLAAAQPIRQDSNVRYSQSRGVTYSCPAHGRLGAGVNRGR